jgi:hypothetical protein
MIDVDSLSENERRRVLRALRALPPDTRVDDLDLATLLAAARGQVEHKPLATVGELVSVITQQAARRRDRIIGDLQRKLELMGETLRHDERKPPPSQHLPPEESDADFRQRLRDWEAEIELRATRGENPALIAVERTKLSLQRALAEMGEDDDQDEPQRRYRRRARSNIED